MLVYIKNGYVIDPGSDIEGYYDILIKDDLVYRVTQASDNNEADTIADRDRKSVV